MLRRFYPRGVCVAAVQKCSKRELLLGWERSMLVCIESCCQCRMHFCIQPINKEYKDSRNETGFTIYSAQNCKFNST